MAVEPDRSYYDKWVVETTGVKTYITPALTAFVAAGRAKSWNDFDLPQFTAMVTKFKQGMDELLKYGEQEIGKLEPAGPPLLITDMGHTRNANYFKVIGAACVYLWEIYERLKKELDGKKSPRVIAHLRDAFRRKLVSNPADSFWKEIETLGTIIGDGSGSHFRDTSLVFTAFKTLQLEVNGFNRAVIPEDFIVGKKREDQTRARQAKIESELFVLSAQQQENDVAVLPVGTDLGSIVPPPPPGSVGIAAGSQSLRGVFA